MHRLEIALCPSYWPVVPNAAAAQVPWRRDVVSGDRFGSIQFRMNPAGVEEGGDIHPCAAPHPGSPVLAATDFNC